MLNLQCALAYFRRRVVKLVRRACKRGSKFGQGLPGYLRLCREEPRSPAKQGQGPTGRLAHTHTCSIASRRARAVRACQTLSGPLPRSLPDFVWPHAAREAAAPVGHQISMIIEWAATPGNAKPHTVNANIRARCSRPSSKVHLES